MYQTRGLWLSIIDNLAFFAPLLLGFFIAYTLNPILKILIKLKIPKGLSIFIIIISIIALISLVVIKMFPVLIFQILGLINSLTKLVINHNLSSTFIDIFNNISNNIWVYITKGISLSYNLISGIIITFATSIYFLKDMDKIKNYIYKKVKNKNLFIKIDNNIDNYFKGLFIIMIITFFEYLIIYLIINHPQALLLAFLASIANFLPQFGSLFVHIISLLTTLTISNTLLVKTIIAVFIFSLLDSYVINPLVYGKSNKLHPLLVIFVILLGSVLFGFMGILLALPLTIVLISVYNYYKKN